METKIFSKKQILEAVELLKKGELVAFPTETMYGLDALTTNEKVAKGVYTVRGRPSGNPLIVTISNEKMTESCVNEVPERARKLTKHFRPDPLMITPFVKEDTSPGTITRGLPIVALRCPDDEMTHDLINELGKPVIDPPTNTSTRPSPTTAEHVYHDLKGKIAGIIDNGSTEIGLESTIVNLSVETLTVLRPGETTPEKISKVLGEEVLMNKGTTKAKGISEAPGMKYRHYVPSVPVSVVDKEADFSKIKRDRETGVAVLDEVLDKTDSSSKYGLDKTINKTAHNLFGALRYFDSESNAKCIHVQDLDHEAISPAYMNRLNKIAVGYHFH